MQTFVRELQWHRSWELCSRKQGLLCRARTSQVMQAGWTGQEPPPSSTIWNGLTAPTVNVVPPYSPAPRQPTTPGLKRGLAGFHRGHAWPRGHLPNVPTCPRVLIGQTAPYRNPRSADISEQSTPIAALVFSPPLFSHQEYKPAAAPQPPRLLPLPCPSHELPAQTTRAGRRKHLPT